MADDYCSGHADTHAMKITKVMDLFVSGHAYESKAIMHNPEIPGEVPEMTDERCSVRTDEDAMGGTG